MGQMYSKFYDTIFFFHWHLLKFLYLYVMNFSSKLKSRLLFHEKLFIAPQSLLIHLKVLKFINKTYTRLGVLRSIFTFLSYLIPTKKC